MALSSFATPTVTGISFLDMLKNYFILQLQQDMNRDFIFQQDGAPRTSFMRLLLPQPHDGC